MSYHDIFQQYQAWPFEKILHAVSSRDIERALETPEGRDTDFLALLSERAEDHLEAMAQKAHLLTLRNFGRTIQLYTPMYLSNYCENQCAYCGFNVYNDVPRKKLTLAEVEEEAAFIAATGLKHILVLTGESRRESSLSYIIDCVRVLKKYFSSIGVEIYALEENEYARLVAGGVDGLTLYQETYDQKIYGALHQAGRKKDYLFRLLAPERGAKSGMRNIHVGALLGLGDWRKDIFFMGLHAKYLQDQFGDVEIGVSIPRLRPHAGNFKSGSLVSDKNLAQIIMALRIFLPRLGISVSTRENAQLREDLLPLGVTRMSAGSSTQVGGHTSVCEESSRLPQFEIADQRDVQGVRVMLEAKGYQPVLKDWARI